MEFKVKNITIWPQRNFDNNSAYFAILFILKNMFYLFSVSMMIIENGHSLTLDLDKRRSAAASLCTREDLYCEKNQSKNSYFTI